MPPEKRFESNLIQALRRRGCFAHHFDAIGCDGWPDILVLKDGKSCLIECKYHTMNLRDEQVAFHTWLADIVGFKQVATATQWRDGTFAWAPYEGEGWEGATMMGLVDRVLGYME